MRVSIRELTVPSEGPRGVGGGIRPVMARQRALPVFLQSGLFIRRTQRMSVIHAVRSFLKFNSVNFLIFGEN